jgi:hypothetical protein
MMGPMAALDPYAPPQALPQATPRLPGAWVKVVYGAVASLRVGIMAVFYLHIERSAEYLRVANPVVRGLAFGCSALGLVWIHAAFRHIQQRMLTRAELPRPGTTPGGAVGRFFIPAYNLYWIFAVHVLLSRALRGLGAAREATALLAIGLVGSAVQLSMGVLVEVHEGLLSFRIGLVLPGLWLLYMLIGDRARDSR